MAARAAGPDDVLPEGIARVRAPNPSPLTLDGTNTYVVEGAVVDPGPDDPVHLEAIVAAAPGGIEWVVLTHDHPDHAEAAPALAELTGAQIVLPGHGDEVGPLRAVATPGHSPDHVCLMVEDACLCGDTVLGDGSVFIMPGEGSLAAYLDSLRRLVALDPAVLLPGHGPVIRGVRAKLEQYLAHRLEREQRLLAALERGLRTRDELLDAAWSDVPAELRFPAALTLEAHVEKLEAEGRLPEGVERLRFP